MGFGQPTDKSLESSSFFFLSGTKLYQNLKKKKKMFCYKDFFNENSHYLQNKLRIWKPFCKNYFEFLWKLWALFPDPSTSPVWKYLFSKSICQLGIWIGSFQERPLFKYSSLLEELDIDETLDSYLKKNGWAYSIRGQDPNNITDTGARCLIYVWNPDEKGTLLEIWNINVNWSHSPIRNEDGGSEWLWQIYDFGGQVPGVK